MPRTLKLPEKLACVVIPCAFAGAVACSSSSAGRSDAGGDAAPQDAPTDVMGYDSPAACDGGPISLCGNPSGSPCPSGGLYYCESQCPAGCEPFA
jgi:hypothetical protein